MACDHRSPPIGVGALNRSRHGKLLVPLWFERPDAAQTQRRSPTPHPEDVVQGAELAGLRGGPAAAGQPDIVDRGHSLGMLADHWTGRAGSVYGRSHSDQLDAAHCVQAGVAANRGPADVGADVNGSDNLSARSQYDQPPDGDLAGDPAGLDTARSVARVDRQHRAAGLRSGPMAGDQAWCEIAPDVAQAAFGG